MIWRIFGTLLPFVGWRRIYVDARGEIPDTGEVDILDERGPYYIEPFVIEWLGAGISFQTAVAYEAETGRKISPPPWWPKEGYGDE